MTISNIEKFERLTKLKSDGFLTLEEFEEQKRKLYNLRDTIKCIGHKGFRGL
jgi:poly-D-alanine transfer protein DltD